MPRHASLIPLEAHVRREERALVATFPEAMSGPEAAAIGDAIRAVVEAERATARGGTRR